MRPWSEVRDELRLSPGGLRCERCGAPLGYGHDTYGTCRAGYCAVVRCKQCGDEWASVGPVGCPCQSRDPRLRRIRAMYRARKRR